MPDIQYDIVTIGGTSDPENHEFTSLAEWHSYAPFDLVTGDKIVKVDCRTTGLGDTSAIVWATWHTDTGHWIEITATGSYRHEGYYPSDAGFFRIEPTSGNACFYGSTVTGPSHIVYSGLALAQRGASWNYGMWTSCETAATGWWVIDSCIFNAENFVGTTNNVFGIRVREYSSVSIIKNCLFHDYFNHYSRSYTAFYCIYGDGGPPIMLNNTCVSGEYGYYGFSANSSVSGANNIFQKMAQACMYIQNVPGYIRMSHNIDDDGTVSGNNNQTGTLNFVDPTAGVYDYHLAATDTIAIDSGKDCSTSIGQDHTPSRRQWCLYTIDVDGDTRSGLWDIGYDEYISAEPPGEYIIIGAQSGYGKYYWTP